jgi:hypothetical protein
MTHTITIEGLSEEEFARITDLLKGKKHNGVIFPPENLMREAAQRYLGHRDTTHISPEGMFAAGAKWCIESTIIK